MVQVLHKNPEIDFAFLGRPKKISPDGYYPVWVVAIRYARDDVDESILSSEDTEALFIMLILQFCTSI